MIYDPTNVLTGDESPLVGHIAGQIKSVFDVVDPLDNESIDDLARAVASFVKETHGDAAVESRYLVLLSSQALDSIGEHKAARRLLVLGSGLMRPACWEISGEDAMWVLDLREMTIRQESSLELVFFSSLNTVLEMVADLWDESCGRGVLGLRHVSSAVVSLIGQNADKRRMVQVSREIREMCQKKFEQISDTRDWNGVPQVVDLDLSV